MNPSCEYISEYMREYIKELLIETSLTGRKLEKVATKIAKEVTEYLLDEDLRETFATKGNVAFKIDLELDERVIWLRDIIVNLRASEEFNSDAKYEFDLDATEEQRRDSDLIVNLFAPQDYSDEEVEKFEAEYESDIRHELEHSGQDTETLMGVQRTIQSADDIWASLENAETYYINQSETPAHVSGWVQKAKRQDIPAADAIDEELYRVYATGMAHGYSEEELNPLMKRLREIYQFYLMTRWPEQDWPAEMRDQ